MGSFGYFLAILVMSPGEEKPSPVWNRIGKLSSLVFWKNLVKYGWSGLKHSTNGCSLSPVKPSFFLMRVNSFMASSLLGSVRPKPISLSGYFLTDWAM